MLTCYIALEVLMAVVQFNWLCWHLTVESYAVFMLLTFILIVISITLPPHSFISGLKPSFFCKSFLR